MYIYERKEWPRFVWEQAEIAGHLGDVRYLQGRLIGRLSALGFSFQDEAMLQTLTRDVVKTSEIEGEKIDASQVRSSLARRLGLDVAGLTKVISRDVEGVVEMMLDATAQYDKPLSEKRLLNWHTALFPTGKSGLGRIRAGVWRDEASGPMQVVSGPLGREKIHYEAPSFKKVPAEMERFIRWFNSDSGQDPVLRAGIAHFWFVTVHPFEDGNGRIARALADMVLARSEKSPRRFYSMSNQILKERADYYEVLEKSQKGSLDITLWMEWFLKCLKRAIESSDSLLERVLFTARFWEDRAGETFNERQRKVLGLLLEDFKGHLTTSKWAKLTKCSQDTALRDIQDLIQRRILVRDDAGGRSTNYRLK